MPAPHAAEACSQLLVPAALQSLPSVEQWLAGLAAQFQLSAATVHRVDLCLNELFTNLVAYGFADGKVGMVSLHCWRQPDRLTVRIEDDGAAFDPTAQALPDLPLSLEVAADGGRGLRLVRHFSDGLHYLRLAGGNQLTLEFET